MELNKIILRVFAEVLAQSGSQFTAPLNNDSILLETGLDSLGFAILVTRLEDLLGYDPFMLMNEPVYPRTFGDFIDIYARFFPVESTL